MKPLVIYHKNCQDGFAAAWVFHRYYGGNADFLACGYEDPVPDVTGRYVFVLDFSFKRQVLESLAALAERITILDHHVSAEKDLALPLPPNVRCVFDKSRSGALIAWGWCFPAYPAPPLIQYVSDRDLWEFKLPDTKAVSEYLFSLEYTFEAWEGVDVDLSTDDGLDAIVTAGEALIRSKTQACRMAWADGRHTAHIGSLYMPAVNVPKTMGSECCHLQLQEGSPVAAYWHKLADGRFCYGLRSREDSKIDVSEIAKQYGGGGHRHAAGFVSEVIL